MLAVTLRKLGSNITHQDVDLIEIRKDLCKESDETIKQFMSLQDKPILLTFRKENRMEEEYAEQLYLMASWKPDYLDVEYGAPLHILDNIRSISPKTKIVLSFHGEPLSDYVAFYREMRKIPASIYKIVIRSSKGIEGLRLMLFLSQNQDGQLAAFCMGKEGQFTRVFSKALGGALHFCSLESQPPYGQFSLDELIKLYHYPSIQRSTKFYALIGDPVDKSLSHITHNEVFSLMNVDARYLKIQIGKTDCEEGLALLQKLGIRGLSVTMPLKRSFSDLSLFSDFISHQLGIINTLVFAQTWKGFNSDAYALGKIFDKYRVESKKVLVIGSGGVAHVISHLLFARNCTLFYLNRTKENVIPLLENYGGRFYAGEDYDVLINATSVGMDSISMPIETQYIYPEKVVFDVISNPQWTPFLLCAQDKMCDLIFGQEMYALQASFQFFVWDQF